jgi:hypothetical protein
LSELLPWGVVEIDGVRLEALSESGPIDRGAAVQAVGVQGRDLVVTPILGRGDRPAAAGPAQSERPAADRPDRLSPTLETFEFEGLEPPPS